MKRVIILFYLSIFCVALFGCKANPADADIEKNILCAASSNYAMAETNAGFYALFSGYLHYADKSDLTNWLPVCSKPNCTHDSDSPDCDAALAGGGFYLSQGRVYFCDSDSFYGGSNHLAIVSMSANGEDRKVAHLIPFPAQEQVVQWRNCFLAGKMLLFCSCMDQSGAFHNYAMQITPKGDQVLAEGWTDNTPGFLGTVTASEDVWGDPAVLYRLDSDSGDFGTVLYRPTEDGLVAIGDTAGLGLGNLADCEMTGAYLKGDILQVYRPNDGYYDINLATGEQIKTMDAQMENSWGWRLTDRYILESPILFNRPAQGLELDPGPHTMLLYDGESWKPVTLPEEVSQISGTTYLVPKAVASDRVFFTIDSSKNYETHWDQMLLNEDEPKRTFLTSTSWE